MNRLGNKLPGGCWVAAAPPFLPPTPLSSGVRESLAGLRQLEDIVDVRVFDGGEVSHLFQFLDEGSVDQLRPQMEGPAVCPLQSGMFVTHLLADPAKFL